MFSRSPRLLAATSIAGTLLVAIFATLVIHFRAELQAEIRQKIVERDAAVLRPVARQQLGEFDPTISATAGAPAGRRLRGLLRSARQTEGVLAVAIFDAEGASLEAVPSSLLLAEIPPEDYLRLLGGTPISRFHREFPLDRYFAGVSPTSPSPPVLEVLLPLHSRDGAALLGFAQYYIDARPLAAELATIDGRVQNQTAATLGIGIGLIVAVVAAAYVAVARAQSVLAERNERLTRANFELALAAKASALGQITSHLIHGLQGPVAGLRAVVAGRDADSAATPEWQTAADYTARMQTLIHETVSLLADAASSASYELTGRELAASIRERNTPAAQEKGVRLRVNGGFDAPIDSHRGSLLCLVASNLIQNAIAATERGKSVDVELRCIDDAVALSVSDEGCGIPEEFQLRLFEAGHSGRPGGSGLGLAISRLLARQMGATLTLESSRPGGSVFQLVLPLG